MSLRDLLEPDFVDGVAARLRRHAIPPSMLTLEVTERVLANDLASARRSMVQLKNLGVVLSMDDFGTGWSSLLMLRTLPVDEVKLDRSFVSRAVDSDMDQAIVAKTAELAHALGLTVVAEGVETAQVLDRLTTLGCDQAQGWHVARPMAADVVVAWSEQWLSSRSGCGSTPSCRPSCPGPDPGCRASRPGLRRVPTGATGRASPARRAPRCGTGSPRPAGRPRCCRRSTPSRCRARARRRRSG